MNKLLFFLKTKKKYIKCINILKYKESKLLNYIQI